MEASGSGHDAPPTVHLLDDDVDLKQIAGHLATELGLRITSYVSVEALLAACPEESHGCLLISWPLRCAAAHDRLLQSKRPIPMIAVSREPNVRQAVDAMQHGAFDFHAWPLEFEALGAAIRRAIDKSERMLQQTHLRRMIERRLESLTDREREVMDLAVQGRSTRGIAEALGISPKTAEHHRTRLLKKMQVSNVTQLIVILLRHDDQNGSGPT